MSNGQMNQAKNSGSCGCGRTPLSFRLRFGDDNFPELRAKRKACAPIDTEVFTETCGFGNVPHPK